MKRQHPEFYIQCDVVDLLRRCELEFWHTENERNCTGAQAANRKRMGVSKGIPDLFILDPYADGPGSINIAMEIKAPGGRLSKEQRAWRDRLEAAGLVYVVIYSYDEAVEFLRKLCPDKVPSGA
jgi:hypothetical protein